MCPILRVLTDSFLFNIQSSWTGSVSKMDFEQVHGNIPWMPFGRYRMFLDSNHKLTHLIIKMYTEGDIFLVGKLLALMSTKDNSSYTEIEKITGVKVIY